VRVAEYTTDLPPRALLEKKLHDSLRLARQRLALRAKADAEGMGNPTTGKENLTVRPEGSRKSEKIPDTGRKKEPGKKIQKVKETMRRPRKEGKP
jgi:hypothetical protein